MTTALFIPFAAAGLGVAFLHAALPTHWLPFVLVGRAQGWRLGRVLATAAVAAACHILSTTAVGLVILSAGQMAERWAQGLLHYAAAALLLGFGVFYIMRAFQRRTVVASTGPGGLALGGGGAATTRGSDRAAFWGLVGLLALSPGEVLLSFYLTGASHGWSGLVLLSAMFLLGTLAGMAVLITLTWAGLTRVRLDYLARYESAILGGALILLGVVVMVFET